MWIKQSKSVYNWGYIQHFAIWKLCANFILIYLHLKSEHELIKDKEKKYIWNWLIFSPPLHERVIW